MTLQFLPESIAGGAVCERDVIVGDIIEEVDLVFLEHQASGD
jgi:hypothetical protein